MLTAILIWNALVIAPLATLFGPVLDSGPFLAVWIIWSCHSGYVAISLKKGAAFVPWSHVYSEFLRPLLTPIVLKSLYGPSFQTPSKFVALMTVLAFVGVVADNICTHAVHYMTAAPALTGEASQARREWWARRFEAIELLRIAHVLREQSCRAERTSELMQARGYRLDADFLIALALYPIGFIVLLLYGYLQIFGTFESKLLLPPLCAVALCAWRWRGVLAPMRHMSAVIVPALANWLCWARLDSEPTPGMFRSPWGTAYERLAVTSAVFWAISSIFLPPIWEWTLGQAFTRLWVWGTIFRALLMLVFPVVMILTTVMAVGGFTLGVMHEEIEAFSEDPTGAGA